MRITGGNADRLEIASIHAAGASLEVRDDGVGFDPTGSFPGQLGLRSMQERVSNLGGRFQIESAPGQGTHILTQVPS